MSFLFNAYIVVSLLFLVFFKTKNKNIFIGGLELQVAAVLFLINAGSWMSSMLVSKKTSQKKLKFIDFVLQKLYNFAQLLT